MPLDLTKTDGFDSVDPNLQPVLEKLQGNILRSHGRDHTVNLFLRFTTPAEQVRQALIPVLSDLVKSAAHQEAAAAHYARGRDGGLFGSFFLSASGYRSLGFSDSTIRSTLPEAKGGDGFQSNFFDGMKKHRRELGDPPCEAWEAPYQGQIDALLLLADDSFNVICDAADAVRSALSGAVDVVVVEHGHTIRDPRGQRFEPFGFADGISQPAFFRNQVRDPAPTTWDQVEPLGLVLVQDRAVNDPDAFGSFYVIRKLEQNVKGFRARAVEIADMLGLGEEGADFVGAMTVGRFRDGTPLAVSATAGQGPMDDFRYASGWERCPLHAHIRKANPRGDLATRAAMGEEVERRHRIVRRGIPYGDAISDLWRGGLSEDLPSDGVGLLFACYQASIANQFAFAQSRWMNRTDFPDSGAGVDPIVIGTSVAGPSARWNLQWDAGQAAKRESFGKFVALKGGEFFFAPSLPFLKRLAVVRGPSAMAVRDAARPRSRSSSSVAAPTSADP